jgi:hypothetical protein
MVEHDARFLPSFVLLCGQDERRAERLRPMSFAAGKSIREFTELD